LEEIFLTSKKRLFRRVLFPNLKGFPLVKFYWKAWEKQGFFLELFSKAFWGLGRHRVIKLEFGVKKFFGGQIGWGFPQWGSR